MDIIVSTNMYIYPSGYFHWMADTSMDSDLISLRIKTDYHVT